MLFGPKDYEELDVVIIDRALKAAKDALREEQGVAWLGDSLQAARHEYEQNGPWPAMEEASYALDFAKQFADLSPMEEAVLTLSCLRPRRPHYASVVLA